MILLGVDSARRSKFGTLTFGVQWSHVNVVLQLLLRSLIAFEWNKVDNERVLDSENRVVIKILALLVEDLRCDGLVAIDQNLYAGQYWSV